MADKHGKQDTVTAEELLPGSSYELAAMFNILERKGLISKVEFLDELERLHKEAKPPADPDPYVMRG